jgi:hypothetical protein
MKTVYNNKVLYSFGLDLHAVSLQRLYQVMTVYFTKLYQPQRLCKCREELGQTAQLRTMTGRKTQLLFNEAP